MIRNIVAAFSTDGAPGFLKTMQAIMNIPLPEDVTANCPTEFNYFFAGSFEPMYICVQDPQHMVVKGYRALMTKELSIGSGIACRATLVSFLSQVGKPVSNVTAAAVTQNKDRMNYEIASKLCAKSFTNELKRPEEQATKAFLEMLQNIVIAYIDEATEPGDRIFSAYYVVFFLRLWKALLKDFSERSNSNFVATLNKNFISTNFAACVEIDGSALIILHNQCRGMKRPELFLPWMLNSQHCESTFRSWRSLSSTRSTRINLDMKEVTEKSARLQIIEEAPTKIKDFVNATRKPKNCFIPKKLLSDADISTIVLGGFNSAGKTHAQFRKGDNWFWNGGPPKIQLSKQSDWISKAKVKQEEKKNVRVQESLKMQAERDESFMANIDYLVSNRTGKLVESNEPTTPRNFIRFTRDDVPIYIKKVSLVWWLSEDGKRVSTDRIWRFVNDRKVHCDKGVQTGDFVVINHQSVEQIVQILAFRFVDGKTFHGERYDNKDDKEVEALCNFFKITNGAISNTKIDQCYVNVANVIKHVFVKRQFDTGKLVLLGK